MNKQKKAQVKKIIAWISLAALVAVLAFMPLMAQENAVEDGPQASILSDTVQKRTIESALLGGGTLVAEDSVNITIPAQVKLSELLVSNGELVEEGQAVATVDRVSVMAAISQVQETLETLREEIEDASEEESADTVKAQTAGTVKIVYAEKGDDASDVMLEHGALAVISLDGRMAVTVERRTSLSGGDTVCVNLSDGTEITGRVESNLDGVLTVTVSDDDYPVGEAVTVTTEDGDRIGAGELYIHAPWNAVAYGGTVKQVNVKEGDTVYSGKTLFTLEDTGMPAQYQLLVNTHLEYEELMLELFRMYQSETLTAPCSGVITGLDEAGTYMLSAQGQWEITLLANAPGDDPDASFINYVGQVKEVGLDGLILRLNPQAFPVEDYLDLSGVNTDTALMTEEMIYALAVPVYAYTDGAWVQQEADAIAAGDILIFAGDESGSLVWAVLVGHEDTGSGETPVEPTEPTEPEQPTEPSEPEDSQQPTQPTTPGTEENIQTVPGQQGSGSGSFSGSMQGGYSGGSSGALTEEEDSYYGLDEVTVASVIPQGQVTIEVTVDELDISRVSTGMEVTVTVHALDGDFPGSVTEIAGEGVNSGGSSKFTVTITLDRGENMLTSMNASVKLPIDQTEAVLTIPVAAIVEQGSRSLVYTALDEDGALTAPVEVTTGVSDGEYVQILSGLSENSEIYYGYYDTLEESVVPDMGFQGFSFG